MTSWIPIVTKALDLTLAERQTTFPRPHEEFGSAESTMLLSLYGLTAATAASGMYSNQRLSAPKRPREEKSTESAGSCEPSAKRSTAQTPSPSRASQQTLSQASQLSSSGGATDAGALPLSTSALPSPARLSTSCADGGGDIPAGGGVAAGAAAAGEGGGAGVAAVAASPCHSGGADAQTPNPSVRPLCASSQLLLRASAALLHLREREARMSPAEWAWLHASGAALAARCGVRGGVSAAAPASSPVSPASQVSPGAAAASAAASVAASAALVGEVAARRRHRSEGAAAAQRLASEVTAEVAAEILALCAQLHELRPPPPWEPRATADWCDLRPCGILSLRRAGPRGRADVERGGAESQEQAADAERLAELSAKLRLWRLLFFALSEYLGPAEGADAPSVA